MNFICQTVEDSHVRLQLNGSTSGLRREAGAGKQRLPCIAIVPEDGEPVCGELLISTELAIRHTQAAVVSAACLSSSDVAIYVSDPSAWPQAVALRYINPFPFMLQTYGLRLARTMISTTTISTISSKR